MKLMEGDGQGKERKGGREGQREERKNGRVGKEIRHPHDLIFHVYPGSMDPGQLVFLIAGLDGS